MEAMTALADLCLSVDYGYTASASDDPNIGPKFLRITDIVPELIDWASVPHCEIEEKKRDKFLLDSGDIVVARTGATVGYAKQIWARPEGATFASYLVRFRPDPSKVDAYYLGQVVQSAAFKQWVKSVAGGAAQPNANAKLLGTFEVPLPEPKLQRQIGTALRAIAELIENNRRRIETLEEMARLIYREWFVHLRFPGHEGAELVDSDLGTIPAAWRVAPMGDVLDVLESGSRPPGGVGQLDEGVPSIGAENVLGLARYDYSKEKYIDRSFFESMKRGKLEPGDVLLYKDGAYIGRTSLTGNGFPHSEAAINEHVFRLRADKRLSQAFLYFCLSDPRTNERVRSLNSNAAQPGISQRKLKELKLVIPTRDQIDLFHGAAEPLVDLALNLALQNRMLGSARDALLPRLISGDLDISDLELHLASVA